MPRKSTSSTTQQQKSQNGTSYLADLCSVIETCANAGVESLTLHDGTCIEFGSSKQQCREVEYEQPVELTDIVDTETNIVDNESDSRYIEPQQSSDMVEDELDNLALSDPAAYEAVVREIAEKESNEENS